jgi:cell division protein ZapA (FtsZ GTPase activity inhibitor)
MTELEISIGGRIFSVACDNEEQEKVKEAAALINEEADSIQSQLGRLPESKMLLLSALMIADRLVDVETEKKVFKEKSEDLVDLKNKTQELERHRNDLQSDYQKLESFVEKMLAKLEMVSKLSDKKSDIFLTDENSTQQIETDQPKLF